MAFANFTKYLYSGLSLGGVDFPESRVPQECWVGPSVSPLGTSPGPKKAKGRPPAGSPRGVAPS